MTSRCVVVTRDDTVSAALAEQLGPDWETTVVADDGRTGTFARAVAALDPRPDAVVVHSSHEGTAPTDAVAVTAALRLHAAWLRAAIRAGTPIVHAVDGGSTGSVVAGAVHHLVRCEVAGPPAPGAAAFAIELVEPRRATFAELARTLLTSEGLVRLAGEELTAGDGWYGVRSHPAVAATFSFGPAVDLDWLDARLHDALDT